MTRGSRNILRGLFISALLSAVPAVAQSKPPVPSHVAAARDLYRIIGGNATSEAAANAMLTAMISQSPALDKYKDVLELWFKKVFSEGDFEGEVAKIYTEFFSENELKELTTFYKTELGKKIILAMPQVMQKGAMVGAQHAQAHSQELRDMLEVAMKEREAKSGPEK